MSKYKMNKKLGATIRHMRKENNITLQSFAESINYSEAYVGLIERGERQMSLTTLYTVCEFFNITPAQLFEKAKVKTTENEQKYNRLKIMYNQLNDKQQELLFEFFDFLKKVKKIGV